MWSRISVLSIVFMMSALAAQAEPLVVAEARGISLAQGAMVESSQPLALKAGQHVTLISRSGVTIKLDGPSDVAPDAARAGGVGLTTKIAALAGGNVRTGEVGTTRGGKAHKLPSPWVMDFSQGGAACLQEGRNAVLWRPASKTSSHLGISPSDGSWRVDLAWPANTDRVAVNKNVPLRGGMTYLVSSGGDQYAVSVNAVPTALSTNEMQAAWMAEKGCGAQAEAMLAHK